MAKERRAKTRGRKSSCTRSVSYIPTDLFPSEKSQDSVWPRWRICMTRTRVGVRAFAKVEAERRDGSYIADMRALIYNYAVVKIFLFVCQILL